MSSFINTIRMAGSAVSFGLASFFAGGFLTNETDMHTATPARVFGDVPTLEMDEECPTWDTSVAVDVDCEGHLFMSRHNALRSNGILHQSLLRAKRCAAATGDSCLLSHEVGLDIPAVFLWHQEQLRMVTFPVILSGHDLTRVFLKPRYASTASPREKGEGGAEEGEQEEETDTSLLSQLASLHPFISYGAMSTVSPFFEPATSQLHELLTFEFNRTIRVAHNDLMRGDIQYETFEGEDAFCLQHLIQSLPENCIPTPVE